MKTPSKGPEVAEVTNIDDSMTPSSKPTPKAIPIIIKAKTTPMNFIHQSCLESLIPFKQGRGRMKSSKATVASEFRLDTFKLKKNVMLD